MEKHQGSLFLCKIFNFEKSYKTEELSKQEFKALCRQAHKAYLIDIVGQRKTYRRYVEDFIGYYLFIDSLNEYERCIHNQNLVRMFSLLSYRRDLVELFFNHEQLTDENLDKLHHAFNTTEPQESNNVDFYTLMDSVTRQSQEEYIGTFNPAQIRALTDFLNEGKYFADDLTIDDVESLFLCEIKTVLVCGHNGKLAALFHELSNKRLIVHKWQHLLTRQNCIWSSSRKGLLKSGNLSSALNELKKRKEYPIGDQKILVSRLIELSKK